MRATIDTTLLQQPFQRPEALRELCFIGIGGIGMSALARFFHEQGVTVSGYDKTPTAITRSLETSGIAVHYSEDLSALARSADAVVYTPAIPDTHLELRWYRENGYTIWKRSDLLQQITKSSLNVCIAGTHGKTTTSTMVAHLLRHSGFGGNAFLGGIAANYGTNQWSSPVNCCVVEADEYDRSFLKLLPHIALISAMDPDHLDIYGDATSMEQAFIDFSALMPSGGLLVYKWGLQRAGDLKGPQQLSYHARNTSADCYAVNAVVSQGGYRFDAIIDKEKIDDLFLPMGGWHNVENAIGAITIASAVSCSPQAIREALACFKGVQRRFEKLIDTDRLVLIDDYAHHPEELCVLIEGVRSQYPNAVCTILFQPHLYSRTRDLALPFARALAKADQVVLLPLYPARELPIEGVSSALIGSAIEHVPLLYLQSDAVVDWVEQEFRQQRSAKQQVFVIAGAGDIDRLPAEIKKRIEY
ncbi:MAG: UDP-N-acetylmuramate--L-alanine ligase [Sphingomonadales bacterium]|nr:UDP-N-acetylmuramate--L-alanine ligase [Sphingomonadales bacterium]